MRTFHNRQVQAASAAMATHCIPVCPPTGRCRCSKRFVTCWNRRADQVPSWAVGVGYTTMMLAGAVLVRGSAAPALVIEICKVSRICTRQPFGRCEGTWRPSQGEHARTGYKTRSRVHSYAQSPDAQDYSGLVVSQQALIVLQQSTLFTEASLPQLNSNNFFDSVPINTCHYIQKLQLRKWTEGRLIEGTKTISATLWTPKNLGLSLSKYSKPVQCAGPA